MKLRHVLLIVIIMGLWSLTAMAASPDHGIEGSQKHQTVAPPNKAFGDPTDFKAAALAGANYLRYMQADFTEDNAGNNDPDADPDNGGYGWLTTAFENTGATYGNAWGITANGLYQAYLLEPNNGVYIAMRDAANGLVAAPTDGVTSAPNITFLLDFASLPEIIAGDDPLALSSADYQTKAIAIWDYDLVNRPVPGNTSILDFGQWVIDSRQPSYPNGLIAWDMALWVDALMKLHANFPAYGYDALAASLADVSYGDSFPVVPGDGIFEPDGHNKGYTIDYSNPEFEIYTLGVSGLIRSFSATGQHLDKITRLQDLLLECQYDDGAFSYQYGAASEIDDRGYQDSAYAVWALNFTDDPTAATTAAFYNGAVWLGSVQENSGVANTSGGFLYSDLSHVPEIGSECTAALVMAANSASGNISATVDDPVNCSDTNVMTFNLAIGDATPLVIGFEVVIEITSPAGTTVDIEEALGLDADFFDVTGDGPYSVNGSFFSPNGISADNTALFTVSFSTLVEGAVDVVVDSYKLRGPDNVFIFGDVSGAGFTVDCTTPPAITGLVSAPGHQKVILDWAMADASDVDHYEIWRAVWHTGDDVTSAYPEYDDVNVDEPVWPVDHAAADASAEWTRIDDAVPGTAVSYEDNYAPRGVYYYEVYAVDAAANVGPGFGPLNRSTNYWLGDVIINGAVTILDMDVLGNAFGESEGDDFYNNNTDVGPTDDWSRLGIPTTDDNINFEDLMVFSMNFGVVEAAKTNNDNISSTVQLAWIEAAEGQYALRLVDGVGIKGVHVRANLPEGSLGSVIAGDLLDNQSEMTFLKNIGNSLDVSVAVMGVNNGFSGSGDLFVVNSSAPIALASLTIEVRGYDNSEIQVSLDETSGTMTPRVFALKANYPNPFNPMTKISFSLPEAQDVRLNVYGVDGTKVATLINETRSAGLHEVVWTGRNDAGQSVASGMYFYRIEAGPYSQVRKMTLMK